MFLFEGKIETTKYIKKLVRDMSVETTVDELDYESLIDREEPLEVTYTVESVDDLIVSPVLQLNVSYNEDREVYFVTDHHLNIRAITENIPKGVNEIIEYIQENYTDKYYIVKKYSDEELQYVELKKGDISIFALGSEVDEYSEVSENYPSSKFWSHLTIASEQLSRDLERINGYSISISGYRIPVPSDISKAEQSLIVHISKYLAEFYKDDYLLSDDRILHQLFTYLHNITEYESNITTLVVYSSGE